MSDIKSKIFVVFVLLCVLTMIVCIAWLIQYGIMKFISSEPEVAQISLPTEKITSSPEPIEEVTPSLEPTQELDKEDENKDESLDIVSDQTIDILSDKVSYDVFIERFDEKVKMSISDEYEFVEVEPNVFQNIFAKDGEEICLIRLKVEDGYITEAYYTSSTQRYWNESLDMRIIFQVSMFDTIPPSEYGEYDSFGNYDVTFNSTAIKQSISVFYRE